MSRKKLSVIIGISVAVLFAAAAAGTAFVYSLFLKPNFRADAGGVYIYARVAGDFDYIVKQIEDANMFLLHRGLLSVGPNKGIGGR